MNFAKLNEQLAELFANGKGECGLEIGSDQGLSSEEYIRIPAMMKKMWCARYDQVELSSRFNTPVFRDVKVFKEGSDIADFQNVVGWVSEGEIQMFNSKKQCQVKVNGNIYWANILEFHIQPPTVEDMQAFYTVNISHVNELEIDNADVMWVHAVRYWSVVGGFVVSNKSSEYVFVDNPTVNNSGSEDFIKVAMGYSSNAWTACAARATSWRKSNHATGGDIVQGYPRRWLYKEGKLPDIIDKRARTERDKIRTKAFYVATHAASVHVVLTMMAPTDKNHWCIFDPSFGVIMDWDVGLSTSVRMAPNNQVAGTAIVVDSIVVLKMLLAEGLAPLLTNVNQAQALVNSYDKVQEFGIGCAVYGKWFLEGHPLNIKTQEFSQHDVSHQELTTELAIVATKYYLGSTISSSAALQNAARQSVNESTRAMWASLAVTKRDSTPDELMRAIERIKSGAVAPTVAELISNDPAVSDKAITAYNTILRNIADSLGVAVSLVV